MRALAAAATMIAVMCARAARADDGKKEQAPYPAEGKAPRPREPVESAGVAPGWQRHVELGVDFAVVSRLGRVDGDGNATPVRFLPAAGFGVHGGFDFFRYLHFAAYFVDAHEALLLPDRSLEQPGSIDSAKVATYSFGARLEPQIPLGTRGRVYVSGGVGWGRLEYPKMYFTDPNGGTGFTWQRADSFAEVPFGFGAAFDVVPRWLEIEVGATGAFMFGQSGDGTMHAQAWTSPPGGGGGIRDVGPLPRLDATFTQTIGLLLIL